MRKRIFTTATLAFLALTAAATAQTATTTMTVHHRRHRSQVISVVHVTVNRKPINFSGPGPMMDGGSVLVPVRGVFESFGGQVQWEPKTQVITGAKPGHQFRIRVGSNQALVNGSRQTLTAPPRLAGGTTYVPLRFASEALGAQVAWDAAAQTVVITTHPDADAAPGTTTTTTTTTTRK